MISKSDKSLIISLKDRKIRHSKQLFLAEGSRLVLDLLKCSPQLFKRIICDKKWLEEQGGLLENMQHLIEEVSSSQLLSLSSLKSNKEVIGLLSWPNFNKLEASKDRFIIYLDRINDPGNLGTIIRTADWFGINRIYCSPDSVDVFNNKSVQASMSSVARVEVAYKSWSEMMQLFPDIPKYAAVLNGQSLNELERKNVQFICIGNEANGLSEEVIQSCENTITIPKMGPSHSESLNAAVAAAILLSWKCIG